MTQIRASTVQQKREDVGAALRYAASIHCAVEEWHECKEFEPKPKHMFIFVNRKRGSQEASCGVRPRANTVV